MHSTTESVFMFSDLYLNNDVTCQKMQTRFCNLTIKDSKNVNLKVPAQNQKRRKLVAFKVDWSQNDSTVTLILTRAKCIEATHFYRYQTILLPNLRKFS